VTEAPARGSDPRLVIEYAINEKDFLVAGESASKTKKALQQLGLRAEVVKNTAIIVYEAAMNVVIHANHGRLKIVIVPGEVLVLTEDVGPGIPDIDLAMQEGYSTASEEIREMGFGAGMGLPNIKQRSDDLKIKSEPGVGTTLEARIYLTQKEGIRREER
jgi:serine/threonine-protein kinase RsbT